VRFIDFTFKFAFWSRDLIACVSGSIFRLTSKTENAEMEYLFLNAQLLIWSVSQM
jgi:hypothetical protein